MVIAEEAASLDEEASAARGIPVNRINALRPTTRRPPMPSDMPSDIVAECASARLSGNVSEALKHFGEWRHSVMVIEQEECQKVETLFWMWRTFAASADPVHREDAVALVQRVLAKAWGVELPPEPLDFGAARKVAKRATRRLEDLPLAWREA